MTGCTILEEVCVPPDVVGPDQLLVQGLQVPSGVDNHEMLQEVQVQLFSQSGE